MLNQKRVIIENVLPQLDNGAFFIKRIVRQNVVVTADIISDGHDVMEAMVQFKHEKEKKWSEVQMFDKSNDEFEASFKVEKQGYYTYFVEAWVDYALNWQYGIGKKIQDNQVVKSELLEGIEYINPLINKVSASDKKYLAQLIQLFSDEKQYDKAIAEAVSDKLKQIFKKNPEKFLANQSRELKVYVDREKALFSTWYEFFPRSASGTSKHGTFKDCEKLLPRVAKMGFDTLYNVSGSTSYSSS